MSDMTEALWLAEMRAARLAESAALAAFQKAVAYTQRMRLTGEFNGWDER